MVQRQADLAGRGRDRCVLAASVGYGQQVCLALHHAAALGGRRSRQRGAAHGTPAGRQGRYVLTVCVCVGGCRQQVWRCAVQPLLCGRR